MIIRELGRKKGYAIVFVKGRLPGGNGGTNFLTSMAGLGWEKKQKKKAIVVVTIAREDAIFEAFILKA